jgi:hypothetical protein
MAGQLELMQHMDFERPETAAEFDVRFGRHPLLAKHHDVVIEMRAMNAREIGVIDRPGDVETDDLGADRRIEWTDFESLGRCVRRQNGRHEGIR